LKPPSSPAAWGRAGRSSAAVRSKSPGSCEQRLVVNPKDCKDLFQQK